MGRLWLALAIVIGFATDAADAGPNDGSAETIRPLRNSIAVQQPPARPHADIVVDHEAKSEQRSHVQCGTGATGMLVFGLTVVGGFIIGIIAIVLLRRYRRPAANEPTEPISLLVAEHAARATRKRAGVFAVLGLGGLVAILGAGIPIFPWIFAIWTVPAIRGYVIARSALRIIEATGASAEATHSTITVRANHRSARLHLTPSELAAAKRRGVPAASTVE
jgi:hypothetical protein